MHVFDVRVFVCMCIRVCTNVCVRVCACQSTMECALFRYKYCIHNHHVYNFLAVLTELKTYISRAPAPPDAPLVKCTFEYLTSFEQGILSHKTVTLDNGDSFFSTWLESLLDEGSTLYVNVCIIQN